MNLNRDRLADDLANELAAMTEVEAERLCKILRGLFSCLSDLNTRVEKLENPRRPNTES